MENVTVPGCTVHINENLSAPWPHLSGQGSSLLMRLELCALGQLSDPVPAQYTRSEIRLENKPIKKT